jgi:hypothetical protein
MPSADLSGFGKAMFEKRMRERNMGMDPMGKFIMPTREERLEEMMRVHKDALPGLNEVQKDRLQEIMETTRTEGQPFSNKFKDAIKGFSGVEKGMGGGAIGAGFDNSALMQDPKYKQQDTINQGMEVSEPYFEANEKAFEKNNPMNAISQETPVGDKVSAFLKLMGR